MKYILFFCIMIFFYTNAYAEPYFVELVPVTSTYEERVESGITTWQRTDVSHKGDIMGFSGTSSCQVIDLSKLKDIDGYFTFQFKILAGTSNTPVSGTTISFHFRGSNIDSETAWLQATKNTIINGINAFSGNTNIGYDLNSITGVVPFKYFRGEFESGVSAELNGNGNLKPVGVFMIR